MSQHTSWAHALFHELHTMLHLLTDLVHHWNSPELDAGLDTGSPSVLNRLSSNKLHCPCIMSRVVRLIRVKHESSSFWCQSWHASFICVFWGINSQNLSFLGYMLLSHLHHHLHYATLAQVLTPKHCWTLLQLCKLSLPFIITPRNCRKMPWSVG